MCPIFFGSDFTYLLAIGFLRLFGCANPATPRVCALVPFSFKLIPTTFEELDASVEIPI